MRGVIEQLYGDFQERELPELIPRSGDYEAVPGKALALIGMRRAGKTFLCYQRMQELQEEGVPKSHILYLNFEDDRLYNFQLEHCQTILEVFYGADPEKKDAHCHFFFDEIQNVPGWERFIRRIMDTEKASVYVTGSSARLLSAEIATSLRGRSLDREVFPFSFEEFLRAKKIPPATAHPGSKARLVLRQQANEYLSCGGFPEVLMAEAGRRREILQSYIDAVILRDVVERHKVRNVEALRAFVQQALRNPATRLSIHKLYKDMKSRGVKIGKDELYAYLAYLTDAFLVFAVPLWTRSESKKQANPKKIYLIDNGIAEAWSTGMTPDRGAFLENMVFLSLRRRGIEPGYYLTEKGREVDFAYREGSHTVLLQVTQSLQNEQTRERELHALKEAAQEVKDAKCVLVTFEEEASGSDSPIPVIPLWKFMLSGPA